MAKEQHFAHPPRGHVAILGYDDVNNRWQVLECTADGYLKTRLQEVNGTVLVQQYMPSLLQPGINTYIGAAWQKQPMIWGYSSKLRVPVQDTNASVTEDSLYTAGVGAGEVWVVQAVDAWDVTTDIDNIRIIVSDGVADAALVHQAVSAIGQHVMWTGEVSLEEGDKVGAVFYGTGAGDTIRLRVWGYKLQIDL